MRVLLIITLFLAVAFAPEGRAANWFDGEWRCYASTRQEPAKMYWGVAQGDGIQYGGRFVYTGHNETIYLELAAQSASALMMRRQDGNLWFLSQVPGNPKQLEGSMTYNDARRFPLLCWRPGEPAPVKVTRRPPIPEYVSPYCSLPPTYIGIAGSTGVIVPANREWCDTQFVLTKGARLVISAKGLWSNAGPPQFGPAGMGSTTYPGTIVGSAPLGALLGRVGNQTFLIGTSFDGVSPGDGTLWLSMNDVPGTFGDNQGDVKVRLSQ